jgi:hypothetical protein
MLRPGYVVQQSSTAKTVCPEMEDWEDERGHRGEAHLAYYQGALLYA